MLPPSWKGEVQKTVEETTNASRDREKTEHQQDAAAISEQIKRLVDAYNCERDKPERKDGVKHLLDIGTFIFLLATAVFTGLAWWVFLSQLNEMRAEQRPWIAAPVSVNGTISQTDQVSFDLVMENVGHLPTTYFGTDAVIIKGEYEWISRSQKICVDLGHVGNQLSANQLSAIPNSKWPIPSAHLPSAKRIPSGNALRSMDDPFLAGCSVYGFEGDNGNHRTPFGVHLRIDGSKITGDRIYADHAD